MHGVSHDKLSSAIGKQTAAVTTGGLGVITAGVFLAGEMAGSGVLALPNAMIGTGNIQTFLTFKLSEVLDLTQFSFKNIDSTNLVLHISSVVSKSHYCCQFG